ncbi:MAG: hypothetical protein KDA96_20525 [Planctomycetaceae bacterium]|nr:hypothetical protein [Planctomycetaceae bacterium]
MTSRPRDRYPSSAGSARGRNGLGAPPRGDWRSLRPPQVLAGGMVWSAGTTGLVRRSLTGSVSLGRSWPEPGGLEPGDKGSVCFEVRANVLMSAAEPHET